MWLAGAKCGCNEKIHQHPIYPSRDFLFPLSRHEHSFWEHFICQIPTGLAVSMQATPFLWGQCGLASWRGEVGLKVYPHSWEVLWKSSKEEHHLSDLVLLLIPSSPLCSYQEQGSLMEEELGYHPALQQLQDFNEARIQQKCELGQEAQALAWRYDDHRIKLAKKHEKWARMTQERNSTFQEVFSMASLTDLIELLPWCVSFTVPFCYMSEALVTAMQQGGHVQSTAAAPQPEGLLVLDPSSTPDHPTGNPPLLKPLLPDIPFVGTPPVGCPFPGFIAGPPNSGTALPAVHSAIMATRGPALAPQRLRLGVNTVLLRAMKTCLNWYWRLDPSFEQWGQEPASPLPQSN